MGFAGSRELYATGTIQHVREILDALDTLKKKEITDRTSQEEAILPLVAAFDASRGEHVRTVEREATERRLGATVMGLREQLEAERKAKPPGVPARVHYIASALGAFVLANEQRKKSRRVGPRELAELATDAADNVEAEERRTESRREEGSS